MTRTSRTNRSPKSEASFLIAKTDIGYRVVTPFDPSKNYLVRIMNGRLTCNCPDFEAKKADSTYSCKHIAAVVEYDSKRCDASGENDQDAEPSIDPFDEETGEAWGESFHEEQAFEEPAEADAWLPPENPRPESTVICPAAHMMIKRSLSPDGKIDSISIELDYDAELDRADEVKTRAVRALQLQTEIVREYFNSNYSPEPPAKPNIAALAASPIAGIESQLALLRDIGSMNSKWGRRFYINVEVSGKILKLFGTEKQLSAYIAEAGVAVPRSQIIEGKVLNIPCRVITKPSSDGRYLNVEQVFEAERPKRAS